jgi:hypothetical protein
MTKIAMKAMIAATAVGALAVPASAYTLSGTIPARGTVTVHFQQPIPHKLIKLTLPGPPGSVNTPGVQYPIQVCFGQGTNNCVFTVFAPEGEQMIATFPWGFLESYTMTLGQEAPHAVPYTLNVDVLP